MLRVVVLHPRLRPVPQGVELGLLVELDGDHHAVRHPLAADVVVADVADVGERAAVVLAVGEVDGLVRGSP